MIIRRGLPTVLIQRYGVAEEGSSIIDLTNRISLQRDKGFKVDNRSATVDLALTVIGKLVTHRFCKCI